MRKTAGKILKWIVRVVVEEIIEEYLAEKRNLKIGKAKDDSQHYRA